MTVQIAQINAQAGSQQYLPYSAGMLQTYAQSRPLVAEHIKFLPVISHRKPVNDLLQDVDNPNVFAVSVYMWNFNLSLALAEKVKKQNPDCLIIAGGPHIPNRVIDFFNRFPIIDIICHGEGEITFADILECRVKSSDFNNVKGISFRSSHTGRIVSTKPRQKIQDLSILPSPYLAGTFDTLINTHKDTDWLVVWETNRGCPYTCTFCNWGYTGDLKIYSFPMARLLGEIDWFSGRRLKWISGCDANFGILKQDVLIAKALARVKIITGFPETFRVCMAKNSNERVLETASILHDGQLHKGVSISMQSLDPDTLNHIKRRNIGMESFKSLQARYFEADIPTFTELIIGLPGETYNSFKKGIDQILDAGQHSQIKINYCTILPNAELATTEYRERHAIKSVKVPLFQVHADLRASDPYMAEDEHILVATASMPHKDWRRAYYFAWAVQCFHMLHMLQPMAIFLRQAHSIAYSKFYESLLEFGMENTGTLIHTELQQLDRILDRVMDGIGFDQRLKGYGDISWPAEEASFIRLNSSLPVFFEQIKKFWTSITRDWEINIDKKIETDLFLMLESSVVNFKRDRDQILYMNTNLPEFIDSVRALKPAKLIREEKIYKSICPASQPRDPQEFARNVVWHGRKGGRYRYRIEPI